MSSPSYHSDADGAQNYRSPDGDGHKQVHEVGVSPGKLSPPCDKLLIQVHMMGRTTSPWP
jgi:hypothetical protein